MSIIEKALRRSAVGTVAALTLASVCLSACGGSSSGTTSHANAAATGTSGASTSTAASSHPGAPGTGRSRFPAIRECLQKNGITLPQPPPGSPTGGRGAFLGRNGAGGGPQLPKGVTRTQFQAALKKCGAGNIVRAFGRPGAPGSRPANNLLFRQALAKYATCLRQNGVDIPAPNTSGRGPIFNTKGINPSSSQFRAATMKCHGSLLGAFRRPPGAGGAARAGGSPPAGGPAQGSRSSG